MIELSKYTFDTLRNGKEFTLYRGWSADDNSQILALSPVAEYPAPEILKRLEHESALREDLDPAWAARPIEIASYWDRPVLVSEDPGGVPLDQLLGPARNAWRSDLYSFGVTLYQMSTGSLPFAASDPMEWVHCHIARKPLPPQERSAGIPACVCALVMKLLAKTAEERYQSAAGVKYDLERCLFQWEGSLPVRHSLSTSTENAASAGSATADPRDPFPYSTVAQAFQGLIRLPARFSAFHRI